MANAANRNRRGTSSRVKSTKSAASFQARGVMMSGSENPGARSRSGSRRIHTDTVPLQSRDRYAILRSPLKNTNGDDVRLMRRASP